MTKQQEYNLEERTAKLGEAVIDLCKKIKPSIINKPIILQLIRSSTSIGANYCEANGTSSKQDFKNKIHICKKEAIETKHWLRMLAKTNPEITSELKSIWQETQELTLIFSKIIGSLKNKN